MDRHNISYCGVNIRNYSHGGCNPCKMRGKEMSWSDIAVLNLILLFVVMAIILFMVFMDPEGWSK